MEQPPPQEQLHFTWRACVGGVLIGSLLCFSNMYFGLQTGWVTMGLLGFGIFKLLFRAKTFGPIENVLLQTAAVATATMPLAGGFVGIIPALKMMTDADGGSIILNWWQLLLFAFGLAFFGVFFAVPLRTQTIIREKLKFPSGAATAEMIKVLHQVKREETNREVEENYVPPDSLFTSDNDQVNLDSSKDLYEDTPLHDAQGIENSQSFKRQLLVLGISFFVSALYVIFSYFIPVLKNLPVMSWIGLPIATEFYWMLTPSFSYVGQGMIMGMHTCTSMIVGAAIGWGILAPLSRGVGWAPGKINNFVNGAQGWLLWISLYVQPPTATTSLLQASHFPLDVQTFDVASSTASLRVL